MNTNVKPPLEIVLCSPRGFCAGVDRAIQIVELALERFGAPVYVRHEIVHNRFVVDSLRKKGAVFVEELDDIPETDQPVIFSAHGVAKAIPAAAAERNFFQIDATCPLVTKVHREAEIHHRRGREIILIGHAGHPEVDGTIGQLPKGAITLVQTAAEAEALEPSSSEALAYVTQTTLSVDDTAEIVAILKRRFPAIIGPHREDICYATTNRQEAVGVVAKEVDAMVVVGAQNSSNSQRLREVAERAGCRISLLVPDATELNVRDFDGCRRVGISAGASAPEVLVEEVIAAFADHFDIDTRVVTTAEEPIVFGLPRDLRAG